ncbi:hypothetical protein IWW43_006888, partial [Coemansia sp. RSA 1935]
MAIEAKERSVKSYAIDFANCSDAQWQEIRDIIAEERVSVLVVNNISVCHQAPTFFDEEEKSDCDNIVNANVTSLMSMIRTVVPQMQERQN